MTFNTQTFNIYKFETANERVGRMHFWKTLESLRAEHLSCANTYFLFRSDSSRAMNVLSYLIIIIRRKACSRYL